MCDLIYEINYRIRHFYDLNFKLSQKSLKLSGWETYKVYWLCFRFFFLIICSLLSDVVLYLLVTTLTEHFQKNEYPLKENHFFLQLFLLQYGFRNISEFPFHDFLAIIVVVISIRIKSIVNFVIWLSLNVKKICI